MLVGVKPSASKYVNMLKLVSETMLLGGEYYAKSPVCSMEANTEPEFYGDLVYKFKKI